MSLCVALAAEDKTVKYLKEYANSLGGPFPGAVGRVGTYLVRRGLARKIGPFTYAGSYRNGERPERWIRYELTQSGIDLCGELKIDLKPRRWWQCGVTT